MREWTLLAAALAGLLLAAWLVWPSHDTRMRRRRARAAKLIADDYRRQRRALPTGTNRVTVAELVARAAAEQRTRQVRRSDRGAPR